MLKQCFVNTQIFKETYYIKSICIAIYIDNAIIT